MVSGSCVALEFPCGARYRFPHCSMVPAMAVDKETVRKVARLARLAVPEERLEPLAGELNGILRWIEQLDEVDVAGVAPMTSTVDIKLPMREDALQDGPTGGGRPDDVVKNAPKTEDHFFVVPKVVE